jgi:ABC-2 type transport system ATP-binding protein
VIGGLIPFDGEIRLDDVDLKKDAVRYKRKIAYAEAEPYYPEFLTGEDLIAFHNSVRKADKTKSSELIERFGISGYFKNPTGTYSSGMLKKLSLVLAFIGETKFILLDEPFVTLDTAAVDTLIDVINEFCQRGTNFIFSSHQSPETTKLPLKAEMIAQNNTVCYLS